MHVYIANTHTDSFQLGVELVRNRFRANMTIFSRCGLCQLLHCHCVLTDTHKHVSHHQIGKFKNYVQPEKHGVNICGASAVEVCWSFSWSFFSFTVRWMKSTPFCTYTVHIIKNSLKQCIIFIFYIDFLRLSILLSCLWLEILHCIVFCTVW